MVPEVNARVLGIGLELLSVNGGRFELNQLLFTDDTAHKGEGCDQSIESTVSDAIVRSWLWSTATSSSPLGHFSNSSS